MIRAVLATLLAVALVGASLPAIDEGRRDHAETVVGTELDRVERAAGDLLASDDPTDVGARRVITLNLPTRSWADADVDAVTIRGGRDAPAARFTWRVAGGQRRVRNLPDLPLRTPDGDPLPLESAGRHRLVLSLDGPRTAPVVTVRRFKSDDGTSATHETVATLA